MGWERDASDDAAMSVGNSVSGGAFHAPLVQAGAVNGGVHTYYAQTPYSSALPPVSEWPQLAMADPIASGVRRARRIDDESRLPPYVVRDGAAVRDERVRTAAKSGGLVLVTGEPLSGKSRTAWTGMLANLPLTTRLLAPAAGTDLRGLPALLRCRGEERCVIWLDELEGHLGEHGLTPALLAELVHLRVPVIATMSDTEYKANRFDGLAHARMLAAVDPVELSRVWSTDELERLREEYEDDRMYDASSGCEDGGIAAYLAVGPELWDEWWWNRRPNAHPHGHLLVRVAMHLAGCGTLDTPIPASLLREACALYEQEAAQAAGEAFEDALAWASALRHGVTGMLVPGAEPDTWRVFPSLYQDAATYPDVPPEPLGLWPYALEAVSGQPDLRQRVVDCAEDALASAADGRPEVGLVLGRLHEAIGQGEYAEEWFRHSADAGGVEAAGIVGQTFAARGDVIEAIPYLERAAEAGNADAQDQLVAALVDRAVFWLERRTEDGSPSAADYARRLREAVSLPPDAVIVDYFQRRLREALDTRPDNVKE
ncbi:sel1 repeat family protein [Streptomyces cyaneofuscatus]|uniref:sel1 repeat family protein n=1 Tax=Streptomyces cyaneofuscatus TaxID=66883 RepID=UPI003797135E